MSAAAAVLKPSKITTQSCLAAASITPAIAPNSKPPTFDNTSMASLGSG